MPNEIHIEIRCHLDSIQELIDKGAQSIIISGTIPTDGEDTLEMYGETSTLSRLTTTQKGCCPTPCPPRTSPGGSLSSS